MKSKLLLIISTVVMLCGCTSSSSIISSETTASVSSTDTGNTQETNYIAPVDFSTETKTALSIFGDNVNYFGWNVDENIRECQVHTRILKDGVWTDDLFTSCTVDETNSNDIIALFIDGSKLVSGFLSQRGSTISTNLETDISGTNVHYWLQDKTAVKPDQEIVLYYVIGIHSYRGTISFQQFDFTKAPEGADWGFAVTAAFKD